MRSARLEMMGLIYLVGVVISLGIQTQFPTDAGNLFHTIMNVEWAQFANPLGAITGFVTVVRGVREALLGILIWDYSFFTGGYQIFQYAGWVFSFALVVSLILSFVRGTSSS